MGELLTGQCRGRESDDEIIVFKNNTGMGIQFAATARILYEAARKKGIGTELPSELFVTDRKGKTYLAVGSGETGDWNRQIRAGPNIRNRGYSTRSGLLRSSH